MESIYLCDRKNSNAFQKAVVTGTRYHVPRSRNSRTCKKGGQCTLVRGSVSIALERVQRWVWLRAFFVPASIYCWKCEFLRWIGAPPGNMLYLYVFTTATGWWGTSCWTMACCSNSRTVLTIHFLLHNLTELYLVHGWWWWFNFFFVLKNGLVQ